MSSARKRYDSLTSFRTQYLNTAIECATLTLPYLIRQDLSQVKGSVQSLTTPWQSIGAKGVMSLSSKLMLALFPTQTSFFKLQVDESKLGEVVDTQQNPEVKTELEQHLATIERQILDNIAESNDRIVLNQALKHAIVTGNGLCFMGKDSMKFYPLNRFVVDRDGNDNVIEIITKESVSEEILEDDPIYNEVLKLKSDDLSSDDEEDDCGDPIGLSDKVIYTRIYLEDNQWRWYQEVDGIKIPKTMGKAPKDKSPWIVIRFNVVDGECYGRGRVEEYLGDLRSLEALMQAIVEGSAIAAKALFLLNPGATTKAKTVSSTPNGGIIQGKEGDLTVVQVNKALDFRTAKETIADLTMRLNEAFLILQVRQSERTTAEEVRMTQMELEQQGGGMFSLLTVELLRPYLTRKLFALQRDGKIKKIPDRYVRPTIVAGLNAIGRGQDAESLQRLMMTFSQAYGPQALAQLTDPTEYLKRLAAGMGIDTLNLIKTPQAVEQQKQEAMNQQKELSITDQTAALANTPMMDPTKNPQMANGESNPQQAGQGQADPTSSPTG
jgi:hypothetical protein